MKKIFILLSLPLLVSCSLSTNYIGNNIRQLENDESVDTSDSIDVSLDGYTTISLEEADKMFEKAKTFTDIKESVFYQKNTDRQDHITYKRYPTYYLLSGKADSYLDAYDETDVIGYVGFPFDGSTDRFYDVVKKDVVTESAKMYKIPFNRAPEAENEISEEEAYERLDNYENNIINMIDETYYVLKTDGDAADKDSIMAGVKVVDNTINLRVTAFKYESLLGQSYKFDYLIDATLNSDGSISDFYFYQGYDGTTTNVQSLNVTYGEPYESLTSLGIYDPDNFFVHSINVSVYDIWVNKNRETNQVAIGADFNLSPRYEGLNKTDFTYSPSSAIDDWDITILDSSNKDVIVYDETRGCYYAKGLGKSTLTIGNIFNPYVYDYKIEIEVITAAPTSISLSSPFNSSDYTGFVYLNSETTMTAAVNPYCAVQDVMVSSSDEEILTTRLNANGDIVVTGKKVGMANVIVASKENPEIKKEVAFVVKEKLDKSQIVGNWEGTSLWDYFKIKFAYVFNDGFTGSITLTDMGYSGEESITLEFTYYIDYSTQDIILSPIAGNLSSNLKVVHITDDSQLLGHCTLGEYEDIAFKITKVRNS